MPFNNEAEFEEALIGVLKQKGWEDKVIKFPDEEALLKNWADILFENNRQIDRLGDHPLTESEMMQIIEQITALRTPLKLNGFINGKSVSIKRDNPDDKLHYGKEVSLKIYDRREIAAGQSRYQIVQQPQYKRKVPVGHDRRGDIMLLINGMPVIHIELKKSGVDISQAYNQIEKYADEGIFTGIFSLVQIFVAMNPEETVYFANPGPNGKFNKSFYFHWADFYNEPINDWKRIASSLLSIPMAHQMIGFYTVADNTDGVLKVMRSYQYYAANAISDKVSKTDWYGDNVRGGFVWHTTGSGKTMTSFKSAQLIANSKDADKVIFLMDRIELGTQSLNEYQGFAEENESVQATENTGVLITKMKSKDPADTLIVTSIQKMSNIKDENDGLKEADIKIMNSKRVVFIIDECHRSTFGDMLITIKKTFSHAIFFGFTGTPIQEENMKKNNTTVSVFGNELHRYSIADGIRDGNVLGFDPYKCLTYRDNDIREAIALYEAKASSVEEALQDPKKSDIYYKYMDSSQIKMTGYTDSEGKYVKGIEEYLPKAQYERDEHRDEVVKDILSNWVRRSRNGKFHAIFATSSIPEAIIYYRKLKEAAPSMKITALFDPNIDNNGGVKFKEEGLLEIISDYNDLYEMDFDLAGHARFKKDIAARLAHKRPYERVERETQKQLDILIVVDQMLTGFDSKWVNTLYLDKVLKYENIIQAFSRTNRLFGPEKPFGTICYYRYPHTMEENINKAVKLYSGDKPTGLFADHLSDNLNKMNETFEDIEHLFIFEDIPDFSRLPDNNAGCGKFAKMFKRLSQYREAARIQGYEEGKDHYEFLSENNDPKEFIDMKFDNNMYLLLAQRYKEIGRDKSHVSEDIPFEIDGYLTEIDTGKIDAEYMNSRFEKFIKDLNNGASPEALEATLNELHKSFAYLSQEEQKYANIFLHDVQRGEADLQPGKKFRDYITDYQLHAKNDQSENLKKALGIDISKLTAIMNSGVTKANINEYGRFDDLISTADRSLAKEYFEKKEGKTLSAFQVTKNINKLLKEFILNGGFDIEI